MADEEIPVPDLTPEIPSDPTSDGPDGGSATGLMALAPMSIAREVLNVSIEDEMRQSYLDYAMSTIIARALPDVRDGLKPVHRRILMAMSDLNLTPAGQHRKSAKIVGECFVAGTLVSTPRGLVPIEALNAGDAVYTQTGIRPVTQAYVLPPRPLREVTFDSGAALRCTFGQQFKVWTPDLTAVWKTVDELTPGEYVMARSAAPTTSEFVKTNGITVDEDIAYMLGFFLADGWIDRDRERGYDRLSFACADLGILEKLQGIFCRRFDVGASIGEKDGLHTLRVHSNVVNRQIIEAFGLGDKLAGNINLPAAIRQSPTSVMYAFLAGFVDGDGSIHTDRNVCVLTSICERFSRDVQTLLQNLGIYSALYRYEPNDSTFAGKAAQERQPYYALEIRSQSFQKLVQNLPLCHSEKSARVARHQAERKIGAEKAQLIPHLGKAVLAEFRQRHLGGGWYATASGKKVRSGLKYATGAKLRYSADLAERFEVYSSTLTDLGITAKLDALESPHAALVRDLARDGISFARVKAVREAAEEVTYDIQVDVDHEFIAGGVLVHNCMGNYHPHGDVALYATMVRMAQDFNMRYPLVDGQGNFGSIDADPPAAQRYTEARMTPFAMEMLQDLDRDTVDWVENYDQTRREPVVLPGKFPNFLCNGGSGIAVGMATNIPPHNLREIVDGAIHLLDNPDADLEELLTFIKGPDFPTAGLILGTKGIRQAYATGRGSIVMQARTSIEPIENGRNQIVVTELPYQVIKSRLIEQIADLVKQKKIEGIADLNDYSDRTGMKIVITLKREAYPRKVLNFLLKHTPLRTTFGVNMLALVDGQPRILTLKDALGHFLTHRREVIVRRTLFELNKAKARAHILEGLQIALDFLDEIIALIRRSRTPELARNEMMASFALTQLQADAILVMQLRALTGLEREKLENEYKELLKQIAYYEDILATPARVTAIIKQEMRQLRDKYGDERRSRIVPMEAEEIGDEDLIPEEEMIVSITRDGYIKRVPKETYPTQHRGGKGRIGASIKEEDSIEHLFVATTHHYILFFTDRGRVYRLKAYEVPQTSRTAMGTAVINLINIQPGERITATVPMKEYKDVEGFLLFATECGEVKRTPLAEFVNLRNNGLIVFDIEEDDALRWVAHTSGEDEIILVSRKGMSIRFLETDLMPRSRSAGGVRGITLSEAKDDILVGMAVVDNALDLLVIGERGISKRTPLKDYRSQTRGGKGVLTMSLSDKTGDIVDAKIVSPDDRLLIMTREGITIQLRVDDIRSSSRNTQGVRAINLAEDDRVSSVERMIEGKLPAEEVV